MIVIVSGVAGSGKTTVGSRLAETLGWRFLDADALHSPENVAKMRAGIALDDSDRGPWLDAVRARIDEALGEDRDLVVACSALKASHRTRLGVPRPNVRLVFLDVPQAELERRLATRSHFFAPHLLESQLADLERPLEALVLDARRSVEEQVECLRQAVEA